MRIPRRGRTPRDMKQHGNMDMDMDMDTDMDTDMEMDMSKCSIVLSDTYNTHM